MRAKLWSLVALSLCAAGLALGPVPAWSETYQVIQLRWYGGLYSGDLYADVFESTSGVPLEITPAEFEPDGNGNAIPCYCTLTLIALGTVASLDWEQAILASVVLDADADYVHPGFTMLPIGNSADLPFATPLPPSIVSEITGFGLLGLLLARRKKRKAAAEAVRGMRHCPKPVVRGT
jgi:hypothetical protein